MGWFYLQEIFEARVQKFFDVTTKQLRSDTFYYNKELGGYTIDDRVGIRDRPPIVLTKTEKDGGLHRLYYTMEFMEKQSMVMTIRVSPDGSFQYISVLPA